MLFQIKGENILTSTTEYFLIPQPFSASGDHGGISGVQWEMKENYTYMCLWQNNSFTLKKYIE